MASESGLLRHVAALSRELPHRGSATPEERKGAEYVAAEMRKSGLAPSIEEFTSVSTFSWTYIAIYGLGLAGWLLGPLSLPAGLGAGLAGLALFWLEVNTYTPLTALLPHRPSQNVIARVRPRGERAGTLVFTAHVDSSRSAWFFNPCRVHRFRSTFLLTTGAMALVPAALLLGSAWPPLWLLGLPAAASLAFGIATLVDREWRGVQVPGATDNASGVAVLLGLAEALAREPPARTEVWLVATGCEEVGHTGMKHLLRTHRGELRGARIVNIDHVGAGDVMIVSQEGMLLPRYRSDPVLLEAARRAGEPLGVRPRPFHIMLNDSTAALARGCPAVGIMAMKGDCLLNWHWPTDTWEKVEPANLERALAVAEGILRAVGGK
ncbi:MAG: M28 family peptidase [Halobacteria archaeon]